MDCFMIRFLAICIYVNVYACTRDRYLTLLVSENGTAAPSTCRAASPYGRRDVILSCFMVGYDQNGEGRENASDAYTTLQQLQKAGR